ncbi:MAG: hypothetical protein NWR21_06645 [Verrucomicrobiales bacterium]|jgi:hypothetical protein|nr:hypothetical protein [Verrucomicrobiales bacterium]MDP4938977.1 hypothetical protein [Verrucomicrobiales bacterium]MDP5006235.1 hypothetical protein [Verrucomicrobiales bacterium]
MKTHFLFLSIVLTGTYHVLAREAPEAATAGFLNVVNLVGLKSHTFIELGTFALNGGEPVRPGGSSGVLAIKPGSYSFTLSNAAAKPAEVTGDITMEADSTVAIICYDEVKVYRDGSEEVKLRFNVLVESDAVGPRLSLISLLREPSVGLEVSGDRVSLVPRQAHKRKVALEDEIRIEYGGKTLAEFAIERPLHYLGFLFENIETGEVELSLIENEKLEYQPPLEAEEGDADE